MRAVLVAFLMLTAPALAADPEVPVKVGGFPDMDACMTLGEVDGLDPNGDNFLAVRGGPDTSFGKIDELHEGDQVWICAGRNDFMGVVYGDEDCGVGTPINPARNYDGPCATGWVYQKYVTIIAG